jgi:hypothetical protein
VGNQSLEILKGIAAVPRTSFQTEMGDVIEENAKFTFFQSPPGRPFPSEGALVAVNPSTQGLVIVTGGIEVKFKEGDVSPQISQDFGIRHLQSFEEINVSFFQSSKRDINELINQVEALRRDSRVVRAELHILDKTYVPR